MSLVSIQAPAFISYCSPVQDRKARTSTRVYEFDSVDIDQRVYKCVWTPLTDKSISTPMREDNKHDKYAVSDQL